MENKESCLIVGDVPFACMTLKDFRGRWTIFRIEPERSKYKNSLLQRLFGFCEGLEISYDCDVFVSLPYLWRVNVQVQTVFIFRDKRSVALWALTAIYCRIQLSFPCTCRYWSLQDKSCFKLDSSGMDVPCFGGGKIFLQGRRVE